MRSRRGDGPLRGIRLALPLRAVAAARLLAITNAGGVERAADDLVADTRQVADAAAAHEHDLVLLQVVALARGGRRHLDTARQPHACHLAQRRVGLLRGVGEDASAHASTLGGALERARLA